MSGSSCATTGSPIVSSGPTTTSLSTVATPGTNSSISLGPSCRSACATGPTGSDQRDSVLGGKNKVVEIDETFVGGKAANRKNHVPKKAAVLSLVERDGKVRSFRVANVSAKTLRPIIVSHVNRATYIMTDDAPVYTSMGREFYGHGTVNHSAEEYVRATFWHTNTVENYFSIFKRGIIGTYHHVSETHLHRYKIGRASCRES